MNYKKPLIKTLFVVLPILYLFKRSFYSDTYEFFKNIKVSDFNPIFKFIKETFRVYALFLIIPIGMISFFIITSILGVGDFQAEYSFFEGIYEILKSFFITGHLGNIVAWRIQIVLLLICAVSTLGFSEEHYG